MEQIIYIEEKDKEEASLLSRSFTNNEISAKVYINSLGAELAMKYLAQEGIDVSKIYNMHNINKVREEFELADIILPNIRIDARMVYDENLIFIPKEHFEYDLLPDIYVVFKYAKDSNNVKFLGYFEPKLINKKNQNNKYYFIEKEKLSAPQTLKSYIDNFNGNNTQELTEEEYGLGQQLALSFIDNDIKIDDKKKLLNILKKSVDLREDLIELDNFEIISYHVTKIPDFNNPDIPTEVNYNEQPDEFDIFEQPFDENEQVIENEAQLNETSIQPIETISPDEENVITGDILENTNVITDISEISQDILKQTDNETIDNSPLTEINSTDNDENIVLEEPTLDTINETEELSQLSIEPLDINPLNINDEPLIDNNIEVNAINTNDISPTEITENQMNEFSDNTINEVNNIAENTTIPDLSEDDTINNSTEETPDTVSLEDFENLIATPIQDVSDTSLEEVTSQEVSTIINKKISNESPSISNQDMIVGEIQLNISSQENKTTDDNKLEVLYDKTLADEQEIQNNTNNMQIVGKKGILAASTIFVMLVSILLFSTVNKSNKSRKKEKVNEIEKNVQNSEEQAIPTNAENIQELEEQAIPQVPAISKKSTDEAVAIQIPKGPAIETPYLDVKKLSWTVPNYISYNDTFRKYLQTAGKSLKLTLSSDLLLATEYSYSNKLEVDLTYSKEGDIDNIRMLQTSGSEQIDTIVLRTVKETLNVVKPPTDAIVGDNLHLTLIIYL